MKEMRKTNVRKEYKVFKCDISFTRNVYILRIRRATINREDEQAKKSLLQYKKCINQAQLLFGFLH